MLKLQFLTVCDSAGTQAEENGCKLTSNNINRDKIKPRRAEIVAGERSAHFFATLFCPCGDPFLQQGA